MLTVPGMDAHHDRVAKARASLAEAPPRLYFAYSTILDRVAFDAWKREHGYEAFELPEGELAEALDVDVVFDFPSRWWSGRVAGLADAPGASVYGRLYEIPGQDWPIVQHKEGAVTGMCVEREVKVRAGGRVVTATAFATRPERRSLEGPVSASFVDALLRGAEAAGLPASWRERVRAYCASSANSGTSNQ